jgi:hypothetical protein
VDAASWLPEWSRLTRTYLYAASLPDRRKAGAFLSLAVLTSNFTDTAKACRNWADPIYIREN